MFWIIVQTVYLTVVATSLVIGQEVGGHTLFIAGIVTCSFVRDLANWVERR